MRDAGDGNGTNEIGTDESGPLVLRSSSRRIGKAAFIFLFAALWNGLISIFVIQVVRGSMQNNGAFQWIPAIFLIPFVLVGLAALGVLVHAVLGIFAPRVTVTLSRQRIHLGDTIDIEWQFAGRVHVIENLRVFVEGSEEATYRRGTSTATDRHVFARIEIIRTTDVNEIRFGRGRLQVPADSVPTLNSRNNKIIWNLRLNGVIRRFPDVADSFAITIRPMLIPDAEATA